MSTDIKSFDGNKIFNENLKIIGIITVPLSPGKKYFKVCGDSYISSAHINWLEDIGLNILPIPYTTKNHENYFKKINGLYFPSGGAFASTQNEYYQCCKKFFQLAINANNNGNYFPIWGGCMGMQQMMIIAEGTDNIDNLLENFDSYDNLYLPLIFTDEALESKLLKDADKDYIIYLMSNEISLNNHKLGLSPEKFKKCKLLDNTFNIISYNYDRQGKKFISTIEAKNYPFYGVQWHPERAKNMNYFSQFIKNECQKNNQKKKIPSYMNLQFKEVNCMTYSDNLYKNCTFYWHKKTSEHNKKLCNVATLGKPENNSV